MASPSPNKRGRPANPANGQSNGVSNRNVVITKSHITDIIRVLIKDFGTREYTDDLDSDIGQRPVIFSTYPSSQQTDYYMGYIQSCKLVRLAFTDDESKIDEKIKNSMCIISVDDFGKGRHAISRLKRVIDVYLDIEKDFAIVTHRDMICGDGADFFDALPTKKCCVTVFHVNDTTIALYIQPKEGSVDDPLYFKYISTNKLRLMIHIYIHM
jgi:hypothetical protein